MSGTNKTKEEKDNNVALLEALSKKNEKQKNEDLCEILDVNFLIKALIKKYSGTINLGITMGIAAIFGVGSIIIGINTPPIKDYFESKVNECVTLKVKSFATKEDIEQVQLDIKEIRNEQKEINNELKENQKDINKKLDRIYELMIRNR